MKKKIVSGLLATTMVASLLFGCGGAESTEAPATEAPAATEEAATEEVVAEDAE